MGVLRLAGPPAAAAVPAPRRRTAGSSPAWSTCRGTGSPPRNRLRIQEILLRELQRRRRRLHHPGHRVDAGPGPLHRAHRPGRPARRDRRRRARRAARRRDPAAGTTTSAWCWSASSATSRPSACSHRYADALPGDLQGRAHAVRGDAGPRQAGAARGARPAGDAPVTGAARTTHDVRFKVFRYGEPMMLSAVLPVLHSLGVRVDRRAAVRGPPRRRHRLPLRLRAAAARRRAATSPRSGRNVENAFSAAWRGEAEVDGFNELVLRAGLTWRQVVVLRAYAKYLRQAGTVFSQEYMESTLHRVPGDRRAAGRAVRGPASTRRCSSSDDGARRAGQGAGRRRSARAARRRGQPRPGPDPALAT